MSNNKHEERGRRLRTEGKPQPTAKREGLVTTKSEVRNRNDERLAWKKEDSRREKEAKK